MNSKFKTVSLEDGMPSVPEARARLMRELHVARASGFALLKIIHGYGSSGVGGDLRIALQATLRQMQQRGEVRGCIFGEDWRASNERTWALMKRFPDLKNDRDLGRHNPGITIVEL